MLKYIVATTKPWDKANFDKLKLDGEWHLVTSQYELNREVNIIKPRYVFFTHWSWKISPEIYENFECIVFHASDLPEGRGSSIIQHQILKGINYTKISAIKVDAGLDTGDVYLKRVLCLNGGGEEIYMRLSEIVFNMIKEIVEKKPILVPQIGEGSYFKRRIPEESRIKGYGNLKQLYDFIRMLDVETYPPAFLEVGNFRFEFSRPCLKIGQVITDVAMTQVR